MYVTRAKLDLAKAANGEWAVWDRNGKLVPVNWDGHTITRADGVESFDDRTKFRFEALLFGVEQEGGKEFGLDYDQYPQLQGAVEFGAWNDEDTQNGSIGGNGSIANPPRHEKGVGWSQDLYFVTRGANSTANFKGKSKSGYNVNATVHGLGKGGSNVDTQTVRVKPRVI